MKLFQAALLVALVASRVDGSSLTITLSPTVESGQPTTFTLPVAFFGTVTDTDTADTCDSQNVNCLYLNFITFSFDQDTAASHLSGDSDQFYIHVPQILSDDGASSGLYNSYTGNIFGIDVAPNTPVGVYTGSVNIYGAIDDPTNTTNLLASQSWTLVASPEPADFGLAIAGLAAVVLAKRRVAK